MKPDPTKYRIISRRALVGIVVVLATLGLTLLASLYVWIESYNRQLAESALSLTEPSTAPLTISVYANAVLFLLPALYLIWFAAKSWRLSTFPPPGSWVLASQQIYLGSRAKIRAFLVLIIGLACFAAAVSWTLLAATLAGL